LDGVHDEARAARRLADEVRPLMAKVRGAADRLERLVDDEIWSLPKYREMLFVR
jgi:glutamine synthetase